MNIKREKNIDKTAIKFRYLYHLVPEKLFARFVDKEGNYDCRNKAEWGRNSVFIHTTPTIKQIKKKVAEEIFRDFSVREKFLLLRINPKNITGKITYAIIGNSIYHHIWDSLKRESFKIIKIKRLSKTEFKR